MRAGRGASGLRGILLVDKPVGMTSHDVVDELRKLTGEKRIGHAGTLDPAASGLLVMMVGTATKFSNDLLAMQKTYQATILFGTSTDTDDAEGAVLETCNVDDALFDEEFAQSYVEGLVGPHEQIPPRYSAIKVKGRKSYEAARKGQEVELKPRTIEVLEAHLIATCHQTRAWQIELSVSKGTYIRALARDIGAALGTCAHLSALRRTHSGEFSISNAHTLEYLKEQVRRPHELAQFFIPFADTGPSITEAEIVIGVFDGLHRGHQTLIESCVQSARENGVPAVMVTFDRLPEEVLPARLRPTQLYPLDERIALAKTYGIDHVIVIPFTHEVSRLSPEEFIRTQLLTRVIPRTVWVGENFRFGTEAAADTTTLEALGHEYGFGTNIISRASGEVDAFSSTAIRRALQAGDVEHATSLLGRPYSICGVVDKARGIGRRHGFPTANITEASLFESIADGVYQGTVAIGDGVPRDMNHVGTCKLYDAAIFIGVPSNSDDGNRVLEAHLIEYSDDLVDKTIAVTFHKRTRDVVTCKTEDQLVEVVGQNIKEIADKTS